MRITKLLVAGILATFLIVPIVSAKGASGGRSSSSRSSSRTSHASSTPTTTSKPTWSSTAKYGTGRGILTGKGPLKSKTTPPPAHDHKGKKYNSSDAIYTNRKGKWVYYWTPIVGGGVYCYDKDHKRIDCDRDDKAYMKDW